MEELFAGQGVLLGLGFLILGFFFHAYITKTNAIAASKQAKAILDEAQKEAEVVRREAKVQAKDAILRARENSEREFSKQRTDILDLEKRAVKSTFDLGQYSQPHGIWMNRDEIGRNYYSGKKPLPTVAAIIGNVAGANVEPRLPGYC